MMEQAPIKQNRFRRSYSKQFKAELVAQCLAESDSISAIAMAHGINTNLVQRWVSEHRRHGWHDISDFSDGSMDVGVAPANWLAVLPNAGDSTRAKASTPAPAKKTAPKLDRASSKKRKATNAAAGTIDLELGNAHGVQICIRWPEDAIATLARFARELLA